MPSRQQKAIGRSGGGKRPVRKKREPIRREAVEFGRPDATPPTPFSVVTRPEERSYVTSDLKRIGIIAGVVFVILIVVSLLI